MISIFEKQPSKGQRVLVASVIKPEFPVTIAKYQGTNEYLEGAEHYLFHCVELGNDIDGGFGGQSFVTHWEPLPRKPRKGKL